MEKAIRILLVDDDEGDYLLTREFLNETEQSCKMDWAGTYEQGLEQIRRGEHDVYLVDYRLGGRDGLDLVRSAIAGGCQIPLIMLTGAGDRQVDMNALESGVADYLVKGRLNPELLERSIRFAIERKHNEELLCEARDHLEVQVAARTAELTLANKELEREIEERKKAEEDLIEREIQLRASEERYRIICEKSSDGIAIVQEGRIVFANPRLAGMLGMETDDLQKRGLASLFAETEPDDFMGRLQIIRRGQRSESFSVPFSTSEGKDIWLEWHVSAVKWEGRQAGLATVRDITEAKKRENAIEIESKNLRVSYNLLKATLKDHYRFGDIVGKSPAMQEVFELILSASKTDVHVVIEGESGTGKELVARAIHDLSHRSDKPFVPVNCGAIPESLFESEFFGHKKGAFTGANMETYGLFGLSDGGTLFLDEVGELSLNMQVKLLRAIEGDGHTQVGGTTVIRSDVRIISATNRNLAKRVEEGAMRRDFLYRIHVVNIHLPPLKERKEDIPLLIDYFTQKHHGSETPPALPGQVIGLLCNHHWPGNVRELQNVLNRYFAVGRLDFIDAPSSPDSPVSLPVDLPVAEERLDLRKALEKYEKQYITQILNQNRWHKGKSATLLGIPERTFYRKLKKLQLI